MRENKTWKVSLYIIFSLYSILAIVPLLLVIFISLSSEADIIKYGFSFIPKHFDLAAYKAIFYDGSGIIWKICWSLIVAVLGPIPSIIVQVGLAYALSREKFAYKKAINYLLIGTMFFVAGMVPLYIVRTTVYGLGNNPLIYFIPQITIWGVALYRTQFGQVPNELLEAANIEGAGEVEVLWHIVLPLSKSIIGIQYFKTAINFWNDFETSMIYMSSNAQFQTIGHYINRILADSELLVTAMAQAGMSVDDIPLTTLKYAMAVVSMVPVFVLFPFVQKFFTKGVAVGSVKG